MARVRNSALARKARLARPVSERTLKRRQRQAAAATANATQRKRHGAEPETIGQARVWQRKQGRYELAGLCPTCASQAAWGHALGFQKIKNPCSQCQPFVSRFDTPGPRGSKWRKILTKLEYLTEEQLGAWLDDHYPEEVSV